jgi:adenylate cyclase class IV
MQKLEVEVKFYLADIEAIRTHILELGAKSNGRLFETNIRYEDKNNSLMPDEEKIAIAPAAG